MIIKLTFNFQQMDNISVSEANLYSLPKELLITIITKIQENYRIDKLPTEELKNLKIQISEQIVKNDTIRIKAELKNSGFDTDKINYIKFKKESVVISWIVSETAVQKARIFPCSDIAYFFLDVDDFRLQYYKLDLKTRPDNLAFPDSAFSNFIFETYHLGFWDLI